ncbi:MAG TPA: aminotransferase class V-fold PLP-dependent enzyme [Patescibacteria group bacterium]|nr:aminotransferase class V-fold PLP-dependent enzyme [Patescibacteria group bacterium]
MTKQTKNQHYRLFCPGPVNIAQSVKEAVIAHEIGHREEEFSVLLKRLNHSILDLFEIKRKRDYRAIVVTGSGSAANETVLSSIINDNQKILVLSNGEFGERLATISSLHNPQTVHLKFKWAHTMSLGEIEATIRKEKPNAIAVVHHETSTGMLNPIAQIGKLAKKYRLVFFVDAVSSAGAEKIDVEKWNISFLSTSSSKAIGSMAGLSLIVGKKKSFEATKNNPVKVAYLNLYKFYKFAEESEHTPNTPGVPLFFALDQAITNILDYGVTAQQRKMKRLAFQMRQGLREMRLKFLLNKNMSSTLTTVLVPKYTTVDEIKSKLREKNIIVYDGKGDFKGKVFQIATIGEMTKKDVELFLQDLRDVLGFAPISSSSNPRIRRITHKIPEQGRLIPFFPPTPAITLGTHAKLRASSK